jgi:hypothetical protein
MSRTPRDMGHPMGTPHERILGRRPGPPVLDTFLPSGKLMLDWAHLGAKFCGTDSPFFSTRAVRGFRG